MAKHDLIESVTRAMTRRRFLAVGGAAALGLATGPAWARMLAEETGPMIKRYRTLGRTGVEVSDISMGCGSIADSDVVRYAYDHGVNLFDTAESYGNGDSERKIGEAMKHMERDTIFIVTKLDLAGDPDRQNLVGRFNESLERLQSPSADALYAHGIADVELVEYEPFLKACAQLKQEGKLRHAWISSHGPRGDEPGAKDTVLIKAAESGHYDVMLLSYGFLNAEEGERVLRACKEKNIGTTIMKSATGLMEMPVYDPENPSEQVREWFESLEGQGRTHEEAEERIKRYLEREHDNFQDSVTRSKPFIEKYGIKTQDELDLKSFQWVLGNPDAHTICPSMPNFDALDRILPLSGTRLEAEG